VQARPKGGLDLTVNKVIAGAGAAATSAVLGSFFGAAGTVTGAALGSVASTVASTVYQRSLDRTRDRLVTRIRLTGRHGAQGAQDQATQVMMPVPRVSPEGVTARVRVEPAVPARPSKRRFVLWSAATVLVFVLGLLAVTGIEWAKGSTLTSGESGTSVGRVIEGNHSSRHRVEPVDPTPTTTPEPSSTPDPSADPSTSSSAEPSVGPTPSNGRDSGSPTSAPAAPGAGSGGNDGSGNGGSGNGGSGNDGSGNGGSGNDGSGATGDPGSGSGGQGGGSVPTPLVPVPGGPGN
jgi:hypothetical protein